MTDKKQTYQPARLDRDVQYQAIEDLARAIKAAGEIHSGLYLLKLPMKEFCRQRVF